MIKLKLNYYKDYKLKNIVLLSGCRAQPITDKSFFDKPCLIISMQRRKRNKMSRMTKIESAFLGVFASSHLCVEFP